MELLSTKTNIFKYVIWAVLSFFIYFGSSLGGLDVFGIIFINPFKLLLPFFVLFLFFKDKKYGEYTNTVAITILLFAFMTFYGLLTVFWSQDVIAAIKQMIDYVYGFCLVFVMARLIYDKQFFYYLVLVNGYILMAMMIMGLIESFTGRYFFSPNWGSVMPYQNLDFYYPVVSFGNPNNFVFVLFGIMPFLNMAAKNFFDRNSRIFSVMIRAVYFLLYCLTAFLASCRMGMLLIPVAIYINILLSQNRTYIKYATMFFVFFGILLATSVWADFFADIENNARIIIWQNIFKNAKAYFLMGTGPANSYLPVYGLVYKNGLLTNPHFWFLEILAEFGIFGFGALAVWYILIANRAFLNFRRFKKEGNSENMRLNRCALKFLIYFIPMSVMSSSVSSMMAFWLLFAFTVISVNLPVLDYEKTYCDNSEKIYEQVLYY